MSFAPSKTNLNLQKQFGINAALEQLQSDGTVPTCLSALFEVTSRHFTFFLIIKLACLFEWTLI